MANSESEVSVIKINEFISYSSAYYVEYDKRPCHSGIFNTRKALFVVFDAESEAAKEAKILKELDYHPAIIRMFCELKHDDQHFIILEDHSVRLDTYVHMKEFEISLAVDVIGQVAKGLEFLHENQINHGNLGLKAIHLTSLAKSHPRAVIAEFKYASKVEDGQESKNGQDVHRLGQIFHFTLFKETVGIDEVPEYSKGEKSCIEVTAMNAIVAMTGSWKKPTASAVAKHPLFWSTEKQLRFLIDVSDRVEKLPEDNTFVSGLESDKGKVFRNWFETLPTPIRDDLVQGPRPYHGSTMKDLLRAIRNKKSHFYELTANVQTTYGTNKQGYGLFWLNKVPKLLIYVFMKMADCQELSDEYYADDTTPFSDPKCLTMLDHDKNMKKSNFNSKPYNGPQSANAAKKQKQKKAKAKMAKRAEMNTSATDTN